MEKKQYTTPEQRAILESVQVPHLRGRSYDEAAELIAAFVQEGKIPSDWRRASTIQLSMLDGLGVSYSPDISYNAASQLISDCSPATERQLEFLQNMGVVVMPGLTRTGASELIERQTKKIPMTHTQGCRIAELRGGIFSLMTYYDANKFIDHLCIMTSVCERCSALNFRDHERCSGCGKYIPKPALIYPETQTPVSCRGRTSHRRSIAFAVGDLVSRFLQMIGLR